MYFGRYFSFIILLIYSLFCTAQDSTVNVNPIDSVHFSHLSFGAFQKQARAQNKPYYILFTASWCAPCHRIKSEVLTHPRIYGLSNENYLAYTLDLENFEDIEINSRLFKVSQLPTILFFDASGKKIDKAIGYFNAYYLFKKLRGHIPVSRWGAEWLEETIEDQ